ncbi:MAG: helix-hairpin-helix domain-containing protein [Patescibacteria group bacterium]
MKAESADAVRKFTDIPNIGPRMAEDFRELGLKTPQELTGRDALTLYKKMCRVSGVRQDPCVLDTYIAAIDFMNGSPARPWWSYTAARKKDFPDV